MQRRTFEVQYADGLHRRDPHFAQLLFMIFALGSIYSDDPRILPEGRSVPGYNYYLEGEGAPMVRPPACLLDLQSSVVRTLS